MSDRGAWRGFFLSVLLVAVFFTAAFFYARAVIGGKFDAEPEPKKRAAGSRRGDSAA